MVITTQQINKKVSHLRKSSLHVALVVGIVFGFCMAELFSGLYRPRLPEWIFLEKKHQEKLIFKVSEFDKNTRIYENTTVADKLYVEVRVLCWIMTYPKYYESNARHVKKTWGKRCNKFLIMSSENDTDLDNIPLPIGEGKHNTWMKTKQAFKYIYKHYMDDADWFLKADDDTYMIIENLRFMLYPYSTETPIYFGCRFKPYVKQGYMSGGAGYVLSKEALRRFVTEAIPQPMLCKMEPSMFEDVEMGICLENVKVLAGDSRDSHGLGKFFPFPPERHIVPKFLTSWYWSYNFYNNSITNSGCCSDDAISFHFLNASDMYMLDFLIYNLQPYGIVKMPEPLPKKMLSEQEKPEKRSSSIASTYTAINAIYK